MLLNVAKCQGYSFYHFWVVKEGGGGRITHPLSRLGLIFGFSVGPPPFLFGLPPSPIINV